MSLCNRTESPLVICRINKSQSKGKRISFRGVSSYKKKQLKDKWWLFTIRLQLYEGRQGTMPY